MSLLEKMRGDKKGWYKVSDLVAGLEIAVPKDVSQTQGNVGHGDVESPSIFWDEIISITPVGREQVYDIEVEGTYNFVGNGIFAHNTYVLRANTMLAVTGEVNASEFTVPVPALLTGTASSTLFAEIPPEVLTADGTGVDLFKLATYNLAIEKLLDAKVDGQGVRITALETRVDALESGAISSASGSPITLSTTSLASAFEGFGAFISKGFAQFGSLIADRFVAAANSAGTSSAGTVSMLTGNTVAQVTNAYVTPATKIFVTFNAPVTGSWYVSDKQAGSFRVVLSVAQTADVSFDYFLVQTEGQVATSTPSETQGSTSGSGVTQSNGSDTTAPVITIIGDNPLYISVDGTFTEPGITVSDNDPYITFVNGIEQEASAVTIITTSATTYIITYKATDTAGNMSTATRSVIVGTPSGDAGTSGGGSGTPADTTAPVVTLTGAAALELTVGDTFTDEGATATDAVDGDLTANIAVTGSVDTATEGSYSLTYSATDAAGNIGSAGRLVTVIAAAPAVDTASSTPPQ